MPKRLASFRLTTLTRRYLDELAAAWECDKTEVLRRLIEMAHRQEFPGALHAGDHLDDKI